MIVRIAMLVDGVVQEERAVEALASYNQDSFMKDKCWPLRVYPVLARCPGIKILYLVNCVSLLIRESYPGTYHEAMVDMWLAHVVPGHQYLDAITGELSYAPPNKP